MKNSKKATPDPDSLRELFENIPPYDAENESRQGQKTGDKTVSGIWVGRGQTRHLIPPEEIFKLAVIGCTNREICDWFGITESTLTFNFSAYLQKARSFMKQRLRRAQLKTALGGNPTMQIWLGKQMLSQRDTPVEEPNTTTLPQIVITREALEQAQQQDQEYLGDQ